MGTIGSENRTRISAACSRLLISPVGCAATIDSGDAGAAGAGDGCALADAAIEITHTTGLHTSNTRLRMIASLDDRYCTRRAFAAAAPLDDQVWPFTAGARARECTLQCRHAPARVSLRTHRVRLHTLATSK
jgi:hypothetical protein